MSSKMAITRRNLVAAAGAFATTLPVLNSASADGPRRAADCYDGDHGGLNCFLAGTCIMTPTGERAVEDLAIGEFLVTRSGEHRAIKWIGRRSIKKGAKGNWPTGTIPVRVARSALGDNVPSKDVYLSPGHAVYIDGALLPADNLVNGLTITFDVPVGTECLDYFHVELASHDVVLAHGMPVETLLDGAAASFDNSAERATVIASASAARIVQYAPILAVRGNRQVVRSRLRSAMAPWIDRRQPFDVIRDRIEERAQELSAV